MKPIASKNGIFAICLIAICLMFVGVNIAPANVAYAALPDDYCNYISNLDAGSSKDWYFGEDYLNISEVLSEINSWKTDSDFNFDKIKEDPIVIAVIDSGIGHAYYDDGNGNEVQSEKADYYKTIDENDNVLRYCINPLFYDVILTDDDGNYVYTSVVNENKRGSKVYATLDESVENIAYVLADNTDDNHGTHVTGTVALLIHALELEDYVKILPIKANDSVKKAAGSSRYTAHYQYNDVQNAIEFAYENGADIVSLSLTADNSAFSFNDYCDDILICAAAGNSGSNSTFSPGYPAASPKVLGVMNYTFSDNGAELSQKSNYGSKYDIAAPGSNIISTIDGKDGYGVLSGTSMATPITAVASAIVSLKYNALINTELVVTPEIIRKMIRLSAGETNDLKHMPTLDLLSLITTDFQSENEGDIFVDAEGLYIDALKTTEYVINALETITLNSECFPENSRAKGTIEWWYECGGQIVALGTGKSISFTPPTVVGTYAVYCRLVDQNGEVVYSLPPKDAYVFTIKYLTLIFDEIEIVDADGKEVNGNLYENEPRTFIIKDFEFTEPYQYSVAWFVDGKMVKDATGSMFEFSTKEVGKHTVSASINGAYTYVIEFEVLANPESNQKQKPNYSFPRISLIVVIVISVIIAVSVIAIIVILILKKRKNKQL